jgi:hypothetical protein
MDSHQVTQERMRQRYSVSAAPGQDCDGCGEMIATDQQITVRMCSDDWRTIRLLDEGFQIWDEERLKIRQPARESTPVKK